MANNKRSVLGSTVPNDCNNTQIIAPQFDPDLSELKKIMIELESEGINNVCCGSEEDVGMGEKQEEVEEEFDQCLVDFLSSSDQFCSLFDELPRISKLNLFQGL